MGTLMIVMCLPVSHHMHLMHDARDLCNAGSDTVLASFAATIWCYISKPDPSSGPMLRAKGGMWKPLQNLLT